jgi:hypothetical protein
VNIYFTIIDGGSQYQGASAIKKEGYWQYRLLAIYTAELSKNPERT